MEEIWKDIPGYEKYYMASTLGRIKSKDRVIKTVLKGKEIKYIKHGVLNHIIIHMELALNVHLKNKDLLIQIA